MESKNQLIQQLEEANRRLKSVRRTWFLLIWLGYSVLIFSLFTIFIENNKSDWLSLLAFGAEFGLVSLVLGLFFYGINVLVWTFCTKDINSSLCYVEYLEKQLNQPKLNKETAVIKTEHHLPGKYLNRGYDEFQIEYIKEALYVNGLTENDVDHFLSLKDDPNLLSIFSCHLKAEVENYIEEFAREKVSKEVLDIFKEDRQ